jgi:hypothetical protein
VDALVEVLYVPGCRNVEHACALAERSAAELGVDAQIKLVEVGGPDAAVQLHFLGSPSIRIDGYDVEPGADGRTDFSFSCRLYRTANGVAETPDSLWIREALTETAK